MLFQIVETAGEFLVCAFQGIVRIDLIKAGCVDQTEEQVSELCFHLICIHLVDFSLQFGKLFVHLIPDLVALFPVETHVAGFVLDAVSFDYGRK